VLVQDKLNTHTPASLYAAFAPAEARRLADRLELHYTPRHGSWLNMAEIELAMLAGQCLDRRLADVSVLSQALKRNVAGLSRAPRPRLEHRVSAAVQAATSDGGAWRRHVKSDVFLLVAGCLSGWPASASYSQP
jgi:hypothetical protein